MFYTYVYHDGDTPIYVGKGKSKRAWHHLKRTDMHPLTQKLAKMKREGREPRIEIHDMPCEDAAFELEALWIALFGRKDLGLGTLLNLTDGGEGPSGMKCSAESNAKRSASLKGKTGKPLTGEQKTRLSRACTVDGITIYPSRKSLVAKLGQGKTGLNHPNFCYLTDGIARCGAGRPKTSCTVDGITIYPSLTSLINALGKGKFGSRSPNFRYVENK